MISGHRTLMQCSSLFVFVIEASGHGFLAAWFEQCQQWMEGSKGIPSRKTRVAWFLACIRHIAGHEHGVIERGVEHGLMIGIVRFHIHACQFVVPLLIGGATHGIEVAALQFFCAVLLAAGAIGG